MPTVGRGHGYPEEERLPWLDPAQLHARERRATGRRWLLLVLPLLLVAGIAAAILWDRSDGGSGGLIRAEPGPYKVKPADPGGMEVEGRGYASYVASEGVDVAGKLDLSATPEAPIARKPAPGAPAAASPAPELDPAPPATGGGAIQLGAFSTEAKAHAAYKALKARFVWLQPYEETVMPAKSGDATVYRLRVPVGGAAQGLCQRLKVAGETCLVVG